MDRRTGGIGLKLKSRRFQNQKMVVRVAVNVLKKMSELDRPEFAAVI
jgi:hypothetical protein